MKNFKINSHHYNFSGWILILKFFRANISIKNFKINIHNYNFSGWILILKFFRANIFMKNFKINIHQNVSRAFNILHYNLSNKRECRIIIIIFFLRDFIFKKTLFEKVQTSQLN